MTRPEPRGEQAHRMADEAKKHLRAALAAPTTSNQWREAVIDELMVGHIACEGIDSDPRKAVKAVIAWHVAVALDPAVSSGAQALIEKGKALAAPTPPEQADAIRAAVLAERERCAKVCDDLWDQGVFSPKDATAEIRKEPI